MSRKGRKPLKTTEQLEKELKNICIKRDIIKLNRKLDKINQEIKIEGSKVDDFPMEEDIVNLKERLNNILKQLNTEIQEYNIDSLSERGLNERIKSLRSQLHIRRKKGI